MTPETIALIESSYAALGPRRSELTALFYARLFERAPSVRTLFPRTMDNQAMKLADTLSVVVQHIHSLDTVAPALMEMGARHAQYGAAPAHYPIVRDTLLGALAELLEGSWDQATEDAWRTAIDLISETMLAGVPRS